MRLVLLATILSFTALPALADEAVLDWKSQATPHDFDRLDRYEDAVTKGMMESRVAGEENGSYNELVSVMEEETVEADPEKLKASFTL